MKLVNPTDTELNTAFAEKIAGWMQCERLGRMVWYDPEGGHVFEHELPRFIESADLVLPLLEKWRDSGRGPAIMSTIHSAAMQRTGWLVQVRNADTGANNEVIHWSLPYAAVMALLRSHGVEVEFNLDSKP